MSVIQIAGTIIGATIGDVLGGPMGALQGASIGYQAGGVVNNIVNPKIINTAGPRLSDLSVQVSSYGKPINKVYGRMRIGGNVIWMQPIKETANTSGGGGGGGKGGTGGSVKQVNTNYSYSITLAIAVCEGIIDGVLKVWADSELLTDQQLGVLGTNYNIYFGTESQMPDPIIESFDGVGNVPPYRGIAYVVIKDFPLGDYGNRVPNFTFEIQKNAVHHPGLEDKITAITLIPGAGEFVYDTGVQRYVNTITNVSQAPMNMHNSYNKADVLLALDQLQAALPNLEYVGLVVTWFATSTDAGTCEIIPKVEVKGDITNEPEPWQVAGLTRSTAEEVLHFPDGTATYGGTPSDRAVMNLINELKNVRGLKIMFYPMIFVDQIVPVPKPWRGRITPANATDAANWFTKTNGYNDFINHYLNLSVSGVALKDYIDVFVIGTEYVGMTSATFSSGVYPAVTGFQNVAAAAKLVLPAGVKTIYAADWSEYHHADGGWFNMDPLWADTNLDVIGIDGYFPLTPDLPQGEITYQKIYDGWTKDEGWDYFFDNRPNNAPGTSNLVNNPFTTTSSSNVVAMDLTGFFNAHLTVGETFTLAGCTGNPGGITNANINGVRTVLAVTDSTHVTFHAGANASSSTSAGGAGCTINKPKYFDGFAYAWKNFGYFWSHTHTNPDAMTTAWTAKMKPIWFSEFGFPSVDACANQPNVFVDSSSSEGAYPRESKHRIDFSAQRIALEATEDFLTAQNSVTGNSNLVPTRFVWTWDARPYPEYPNLSSVWADYHLWITGHWIEGKVGASTVGAIIADFLADVAITDYDVSTIQDIVNGYCINNVTDVRSNIQDLIKPFFFDVVESSGTLKFVKRGQASVVTISENDIVPPSGGGNIRSIAKITRKQEIDLPQIYSINYYNQSNNYEQNTQVAQRQTTSSVNQINLNLNLSLDDQTAQNIVGKLLYTDWMNRTSYVFNLPPKYAYIEPADVITLTINNVERTLRVISTDMQQNGMQAVTAVTEDISTYDFYQVPGNGGSTQQLPTVIPVTQLDLMDLPAFPHDSWTDIFMSVAETPLGPNWAGAILYRSDDGGVSGGNSYIVVSPLAIKSTLGVANGVLAAGNTYTWDYGNTVDITLLNGTLASSTELAVLNGANSAALGTEIIQFLNATLIDTNTYRLSTLLRGRLGTEDQIGTHLTGENFVLLDNNITRQVAPVAIINVHSFYKCVTVGATLGTTTEQPFTYNARQLKPYSPVQITGTRDISLNLTINWVRRTRVGGEMRDASEIPLSEQDERYEVDIYDGVTVVRTISSTSSTCSYSAAEQTTDFGSPQSSIDIKVYQISATVGRGIAGIATV